MNIADKYDWGKEMSIRDGSSLFFVDRVELEPIFFRSSQAWAIDIMSQAITGQKFSHSSSYWAKKIPIRA